MQNNKTILQDNDASFMREWTVLHNDHEKYERYSLLIKLSGVLVSLFSIIFDVPVIIAIILISIVWLQDGIWKTFQSRMAERILLVERYIKEQGINEKNGFEYSSPEASFQFYTDWEKKPKGTMCLVKEYLKNSIRPTVAFPYVVLILLQVLIFIF